jgi:hypothetical protein
MPTGILEVKLGRPYEMPERRLRLLLEQARRDCCKARNAAITHWLLWRRQNPDWEPGGYYKAPARKIKRKAKPIDPDKPPRPLKDPPYAPREFLSREMYAVAVAAAPRLSASACSSCVQEVNTRLRANTPYNHDGQARYIWQAILAAEVSLPTWRGGRIPIARAVVKLVYTHDHCSLRFPLLSKKSGYQVLSPLVRLHASDLKTGNRHILRRLASGNLRMADSQIVERKGQWYAQLCYDVPVRAVDLPVDRVMTIQPSLPNSPRPFTAMWMTVDGRDLTWGLGHGKPLIADYRRVQARRRALRQRYSDGCGSGHGRKRWYRTIRPLSRYVVDLSARFRKQLVADIISLAIREKCGSVLYREPSRIVRKHSWFTTPHDVPMDWTNFESRLSYKCEVAGIEYDVQRIGMAEWRPKKDAG